MQYKVVVTDFAQNQLDNILFYIRFNLENREAVVNVLDDFEETISRLSYAAESLRFCPESNLAELGYRKISFQRHSYLMLYLINDGEVHVDRIYHELQDYANLPENVI